MSVNQKTISKEPVPPFQPPTDPNPIKPNPPMPDPVPDPIKPNEPLIHDPVPPSVDW